jgi:hypothetical protein
MALRLNKDDEDAVQHNRINVFNGTAIQGLLKNGSINNSQPPAM